MPTVSLSIIRHRCGMLLRDAVPALVLVGGLVLAVGLAAVPDSLSTGVRYAGSLLQILGLLSVAAGLRQLRLLFGLPTVVTSMASWFGRLGAVLNPPTNVELAASTGGYVLAGGDLNMIHRPGPETPLERRLEILEQNLDRLRDDVSQGHSKLNRQIDSLRTSTNAQIQLLERTTSETSQTLREAAVGGIHLDTVGLLWLALGVLGTSVPDEVASGFHWLAHWAA